MRGALGLARRGLGQVAPNPAVGCVIVRDSRIVGRGWTQPGGRPHAETEALQQAGGRARGATAYVTLEPCAHHGQTPPCADALVGAGIKRCVVALPDPDPRVSGQGIERLKAAGIDVLEGVLTREAERLNEGFLTLQRLGRPMLTLKLATTLDGKIATASGDSKWITGPQARRYGHLLRASHDAILTGIGTVLADDPMLDCRLEGLEHRSPKRVVMDSAFRLPPACQLARTAERDPILVLTGGVAPGPASAAKGVEQIALASGADGRVEPGAALQALGERGITRVLAECGAELAASLLAADLVDRIAWFRAPSVMGGDGRGALGALGLEKAGDARRNVREATLPLGEDMLETYCRTSY